MFYAGLALAVASCSRRISVDQVLARYQPEASYPPVAFRQPAEGSVVPPDIAPITFTWEQPPPAPQAWVILFEGPRGTQPRTFTSEAAEWTPDPADWEQIKQESVGKTARITVLGVRQHPSLQIVLRGQVSVHYLARSCRGAYLLSRSEPALQGGGERPYAYPLAVRHR